MIENIAVAIKPLYKAPIIFLFEPNLTKKVPAIDYVIIIPATIIIAGKAVASKLIANP